MGGRQIDRTPEYAKTGFQSFLNPIEELELKDAVSARAKKISFGGRTFLIGYHGKEIFLKPKDGFVPCGWFVIDRIGEFS